MSAMKPMSPPTTIKIVLAATLAVAACLPANAARLKLGPGQRVTATVIEGFSTFDGPVQEQYPITVRFQGLPGSFSGYALYARGRTTVRVTTYEDGRKVIGFVVLPVGGSGGCWSPKQQVIKSTCEGVALRPGTEVAVVFPGGIDITDDDED